MSHIVLLDNHDSFVYNLVDALAATGHECTVFRNTVPLETVLQADPDLICLSPGPGHPRDAGILMPLLEEAIGRIPILGICLGFQALLEHLGGRVQPCGPVHGRMDRMRLLRPGASATSGAPSTSANPSAGDGATTGDELDAPAPSGDPASAASAVFDGLTVDGVGAGVGAEAGRLVPVARYHSLGCTKAPAGLIPLAEADSEAGPVIMAGVTEDGLALGLQFHPESVLTPAGPHIITRSLEYLLGATQPATTTAAQKGTSA